MSKLTLVFIMIVAICQSVLALDVKIAHLSGDVKVRKGLSEKWQSASIGMILKDIDTILTGEKSNVKLALNSEQTFLLTANSVMDISDLRKITERELFLFLTREKVQRLPKMPSQNSSIKISNVTAVHGDDKSTQKKTTVQRMESWAPEKNGALALYDQGFFPNAIIKLHKIMKRNAKANECTEMHVYLAQTFEAMEKRGEALGAYKTAKMQPADGTCNGSKWKNLAEEGIERLKK